MSNSATPQLFNSPTSIRFHNTLTGRKEAFEPLQSGNVGMYVCGITPYDVSHLGHARCYVFFDAVRRHLIALGYKVLFVQNFTDVDDKIIARAKELGESPLALAERYIQDFQTKMAELNVLPADHYPRVSECIPDIVQFIDILLSKDYAYRINGDVYYRIARFKDYGKLSKRALDEMGAGARVEVNEKKENPLDFALWKAAKSGEISWESPWGPGRPGWHIECSAMSGKFLGETFDLHGGGQDLIFPHHENEIAQSEARSGKTFARFWLHNGFVTVDREKMSKSLGNFFSLSEIFAKVSPDIVRFFLLSRHYKTPLDFSDDLLDQAKAAYGSLQEVNDVCFFLFGGNGASPEAAADFKAEFFSAMSDDFNTEKAIAVLFKIRSAILESLKKKDLDRMRLAWKTLLYLSEEILGLRMTPRLNLGQVQKIKMKLSEREGARKSKDWEKADAIRKELEAGGFSIEDTPVGPLVKVHG